MGNEAFVESVLQEIIRPGVEQLMSTRYFTELREGKLSRKRLKGFALQHYLSNHVINKGLAFCMVRTPTTRHRTINSSSCSSRNHSHPGLMKRFG